MYPYISILTLKNKDKNLTILSDFSYVAGIKNMVNGSTWFYQNYSIHNQKDKILQRGHPNSYNKERMLRGWKRCFC